LFVVVKSGSPGWELRVFREWIALELLVQFGGTAGCVPATLVGCPASLPADGVDAVLFSDSGFYLAEVVVPGIADFGCHGEIEGGIIHRSSSLEGDGSANKILEEVRELIDVVGPASAGRLG